MLSLPQAVQGAESGGGQNDGVTRLLFKFCLVIIYPMNKVGSSHSAVMPRKPEGFEHQRQVGVRPTQGR